MNGVVETLQGAASAAAGVLGGTVVDEPPSDNPSAGSGASSGAMPEPSLPSAPLPPLGGSSFSLSGGQAGAGGLLAPVLVGVLAAGLVLLRPDGPLSRVFCALVRLGSVVPVPLEWPG